MQHRTSHLLLLFALLSIFTQSQVCSGATFFNGQRCAPCATNCQCSSQNTCTSCLPGYTYDALFQNCLQCPTATDAINIGCDQCCFQVKGQGLVCASCPALTYVFQQGGQCLRVEGCLQLSSQGVCLSCNNGFYLSQGVCAACDATCATCQDSTVCLSCSPGNFNATNANLALCQSCSTGCKTCSDAATCSDCMVNYRLNGVVCTICTANCATCSAAACLTCDMGVLVGVACYLCTDISQQGSLGCTSCISSGSRVECTACASGYYLDPATKACATCGSKFSNSIICNFDMPLQCLDDSHATLASRYYLSGGLCVSNTKLCKSMSDSVGNCGSCYFDITTGYYSLLGGVCTKCNVVGCLTYSSTCQCLSCNNGYQFMNNQCNACQTLHCNVCQALVTACQTCAVSYGRLSSACLLCQPANCYNCDGDNTICSTCNAGYFLSGGLCYGCQSNCMTCMSGTQCTACSVGYYLQSNGRCKSLPSNCISMDSTSLASNVGSCKRCNYGYILLDGNCYPCGLSLFNLQLCNDYHCPDYYAQLTYQPKLTLTLLAIVILMMLLA